MLLRIIVDKPGIIDLPAISKQNGITTIDSSAKVLSKVATSKEAFGVMDPTVSNKVQEAICTNSFNIGRVVAIFVPVVPLQVVKGDLSYRS